MIVYHYHPDTGDYLNASEADEDPMEPGNWLIPANATKLPPTLPVNAETHRARFDGFKWVVEALPVVPALHKNLKAIGYSPTEPIKMWPHMSIKEALKGGVS
jgi:hypothetical protein